ncbi:MAG: hypothetical protein EKK54_12145 [Neisseriaceae bacterium]|nr:MAG: hypothetical protein EKK54_12145 [Neisseriaceae bacterium]
MKNQIDQIEKIFKNITGLDIKEKKYLTKGNVHKNGVKKLDENYQCIYMFFSEKCCLKVGYVDQGSPQRWNSHHYTAPRTEIKIEKETGIKKVVHPGSTLPRSIMLDSYAKHRFQESSHNDIDSLNNKFKSISSDKLQGKDTKKLTSDLSKEFRSFIENNTDRVELSIEKQKNTFAIKLLESISIYILNPQYEGKN